jgi:hypothetical protein
MSAFAARLPGGLRRKPVAAGIASMFALAAPHAALASSTWNVTSCADSGAGSLRAVIAAPTTLSGDTVSLASLSCPGGDIALTSSSISIGQNSLKIVGPGKDALRIDAATMLSFDRVFTHSGTGTLDVRDVAFGHGSIYRFGAGETALGGCIYSKGDVYLRGVGLAVCSAVSVQDSARGGAVYAKGDLTIDQSMIRYNGAFTGAAGSKQAFGGGLAAHGALTVTGSTITGNEVNAPNAVAGGGGAWAAGNATLKNSVVVSGNEASSDNGTATGGGLFVQGNLEFNYGVLSGNTASLTSNGSGCGGGGANVLGNFSAKYSTIDSNVASGPVLQTSSGGVAARGNIRIEASTISNNSASGIGGGLYASDAGAVNAELFLRNATISGNHANWIGGISSTHKTNSFYNSTIAFNTADAGTIAAYYLSPGVQIGAFFQDVTAKFQSSIISNNTAAGAEDDLGTRFVTHAVQVTITDSLLRASSNPQLPTNPACPLLGPLRDNGGLTKTHALMSKSPAIDAGNDDLINPNTLSTWGHDQRGPMLVNGVRDYVRASGIDADIGAYEVQKDDVVFNATFDGCLAVP